MLSEILLVNWSYFVCNEKMIEILNEKTKKGKLKNWEIEFNNP